MVALGEVGPEAKAAIPALAELLADEPAAAMSLAGIGGDSIGVLVDALKAEEPTVRARSASAIAEIAASAHFGARQQARLAAAVPGLTKALKDESADVRYWAAFALGKIGPKDGEVIAALIEALNDQDGAVRNKSSFALSAIGDEAVPALIEALKHQQPAVRLGAAQALGGIHSGATAAAVPPLGKALSDTDSAVRYHAALALKSIGAEASAAVPELVKALRDQDQYVRNQAGHALAEMGRVAAAAIVPELKDAEVCYQALGILRRIGAESKPAVAAVTEALKNEDEAGRYEIGRASCRERV